MEGVEINALADITPGNLAHAQGLVEERQGKRPEGYGDGPEHFRKLVLREDIDAVIGATPPDWHAPIAVAAMRAKKYAATEVPTAHFGRLAQSTGAEVFLCPSRTGRGLSTSSALTERGCL